LAIGLFCTWSLDTRRLSAFMADKVDVDCIHKMDIPPPPAEIMVVETDQARLEFPLSQIRALVPNSCSICPDLSAELSDLSVGVLEGRPDLNTLIIRTPKGEDLAGNAEKDGFLITAEIPPENFEHLCLAAGDKKRRAFQQLSERDLVNTDGGKRAALRVNASTLKRIGVE
jgi:coenzyme F420 hydrogenase subunit beta